MKDRCSPRSLAGIWMLMALLLSTTALGQYSPSELASVQLSAVVQSSPARITLSWPNFPSATGYTIHRKLRSGTSWGSTLASLSGSTTSYQDNSVSLNTVYEYRVVRSAASGSAQGYLCSGIEVLPTEYMGKVILLVDNTLSAGLASEIAQLENDLRSDGWVSIKHEVSPGATKASVRTLVTNSYNSDPTNVKAVYIIGHVPVPYSGDLAPDGHDDQHKGAWPCDAYYGELTSTWTDNTVNNTTGWPDNQNVPGDGKFDQSDPPSTVELQVGRVDLGDMPYFSNTHTQRLSAYLARAHAFKTTAFIPQTRGIIYDDLQDVPTPLAGSGWRSISTLVGAANITEATPSDALWLQQIVHNQSYLWTYGSGGGLLGNDNGVLMFHYQNKITTTQQLAQGTYNWGGVFNMCMGSYIGDWNNRNCVMRALLCAGNGLTNVFSGQPNYWFHTMGMGENIGSAMRLSINNTTLYTPQTGGDGTTAPRAAMSLLGDPTLRLFYTPPASNLTVTNNAGNAAFTWAAAEGSPAGYHLYSFNANGVPVRVNPSLIVGTSFNSTQPFVAGAQYMVRAVKLRNTASGSYYDLSLGAIGTSSSNVQLAADVMLEGPYNSGTGMMTDALRSAGLIPLTEPYTALGYTQVAGGGGETTTNTVLNITGNNAIVDWVRVELRSSASPTIIVATRQGLLQRDGDIVATDGTSALSFNVGAGSYHVAVRHRNHLGAMTGAAVALNGSALALEFDNPSQGLYGTEAMTTVGAVRCLWAGNVNLNSDLKYTGSSNDRDPILTRVGSTTPNNSAAGYHMEDIDLSGAVTYTGAGNDRDRILLNVGSTTPNNTRAEQLP